MDSESMQKDRAKHNILPLSKFGLMQITRQRVRPAMDVNVEETCPTCFGSGKIKSSILFTDQLERKIDRLVNKIGVKKFIAKSENITIGELLDIWAEEELKTGTLSNGTVQNYLGAITNIKKNSA